MNKAAHSASLSKSKRDSNEGTQEDPNLLGDSGEPGNMVHIITNSKSGDTP